MLIIVLISLHICDWEFEKVTKVLPLCLQLLLHFCCVMLSLHSFVYSFFRPTASDWFSCSCFCVNKCGSEQALRCVPGPLLLCQCRIYEQHIWATAEQLHSNQLGVEQVHLIDFMGFSICGLHSTAKPLILDVKRFSEKPKNKALKKKGVNAAEVRASLSMDFTIYIDHCFRKMYSSLNLSIALIL